MMHIFGLVLLTIACVEARTFNNPILADEQRGTPGPIKVNDTYYVVSAISDTSYGIFPLHKSTDLNQWEPAGFVFDGSNRPTWARYYNFVSPKIHQIGSNFVLYFIAQPGNFLYQVGAAVAPHPLGPYTSMDEPLLLLPKESLSDPTTINDEGNVYLTYASGLSEIKALKLNSDGLSFSSNQTTTLLKPSLDWEDNLVYSPWYIRRGSYHYLLYTSYVRCEDIGVARSTNALGPYEKLPKPITVPSTNYKCPGNPSIVKDLDGQSDVVFLNAENIEGPESASSVLLATLSWDANDWPYIQEF